MSLGEARVQRKAKRFSTRLVLVHYYRSTSNSSAERRVYSKALRVNEIIRIKIKSQRASSEPEKLLAWTLDHFAPVTATHRGPQSTYNQVELKCTKLLSSRGSGARAGLASATSEFITASCDEGGWFLRARDDQCGISNFFSWQAAVI